MRQLNSLPRGGVIRWRGPSPTHRYSPERVDGLQLIQIERFLGEPLAGFLAGHPCIAARTLAADRSFHYAVYKDMKSVETAVALLNDIATYYRISDSGDEIMKSLICIFTEGVQSNEHFSEVFWSFVQLVHDIDSLTHPYDSSVSSNPLDPNFELSFRGRAAFPATLHNAHSRPARKFAYPAFALNQSAQFNALRSTGQFEDWQRKIRTADAGMDPSHKPNPLLADHGSESSAAQLGQFILSKYPFKARSADERVEVGTYLINRAQSEGASSETINYIKKALT